MKREGVVGSGGGAARKRSAAAQGAQGAVTSFVDLTVVKTERPLVPKDSVLVCDLTQEEGDPHWEQRKKARSAPVALL